MKPKPDPGRRPDQINRGEAETRNLAECLAVDFALLHRALFPRAGRAARASVAGMAGLGISRRMASMAALLLEEEGPGVLSILKSHPSDTARSWGAFVVGQLPGLTLAQRLERIRPYADDPHFGVREWAWMAVRAHVAGQLGPAIRLLARWTEDPSPRVRRFATEATRPRGVWSEHIEALKASPELGLPVLEPLKADPERYVQDSVANWLNDASKTRPDWVRKLCRGWSTGKVLPATAYIVKRATRSLK
jgi:3-methyladenine DNA glycosylase AlkC